VTKKRLKEICDILNNLTTELRDTPLCDYNKEEKGASCVRLQNSKTSSKNLHTFDPSKMCNPCATYWHAICGFGRACLIDIKNEKAK